MEAFETWWKVQQDNKDSQSWKKLHRGIKDVTKDGWCAALEWIYIEATGTDLSTMRDLIDKELSETGEE